MFLEIIFDNAICFKQTCFIMLGMPFLSAYIEIESETK